MRIYKQQGKTQFNPADSLRDTFSAKEIDFLRDYNHNSPLYKLEANRNNYLWDWCVEDSRISRRQEWIDFPRIDDFLVTMYKLLNGNKLNLSDKDFKFLYKIVDKVALIKVRNMLAKEYENFLDNEWIG